jgi:hypothetical protein
MIKTVSVYFARCVSIIVYKRWIAIIFIGLS